ncbi:MAG: PAS domain-containing sensor histidine kinase [Clostridia bacterium]|nr:PAS domain-containing sensor histidine kinase [Clostridia bacterium]
MKNKILRRVILIMTVAVFVTVALTFFLFNIYTINSIKDFLNQETKFVADKLKDVHSLEEVKFVIEEPAEKEKFYKIVVFDSQKHVGYQNTPGQLDLGRRIMRQIEKAETKGENFFLGSSYQKGMAINYAVKVQNENVEGGYLILMCSVDVIYNTGPYFLIVVIAVLIWAGVILASYFALTLNMKFATIPFEKLEGILVDINNGEYTPMQVPEKLNFPEFKAVLTKVDDIAGDIAKNLVNLQYEQKKSSILLHSVNQGIIVVSQSGRIVLNNSVALQIFGKENDVVGVDLGYLIDNEDLLAALKQSLESKKYYVGEIAIGEEIFRVETSFDIVDESDVITGDVMIIIFTNVTMEVNSAKIRSEFFANASHELKTPLTAISGYSELMTMDGVSQKQLDVCIREINSNAVRMKSLIDDMLKLSKLDADMDNEELSSADMGELCEQVVKELKGVADSKGVKLSWTGKAQLICRPKMIVTMMTNLVNNAIKYNKEGGKVEVILSEKKDEVTLVVKDNGIGIAKEHQSRLFERFYKVDASRTYTNESSTGLGLAIVKRIAVIHGAKISLKSELGAGSEFKVVFPKSVVKV